MFENFFALLGLTGEPATTIPPITTLEIHAAPTLAKFSEPVVGATAAIVVDLTSGKILWSKNPDEKLPIASLTKLMTAVVTRENLKQNDIVTVSATAADQPPAKVGLRAGEKISVASLLKALLIDSANDAAVALGEKIGTEIFVEKMNAKAIALGLVNSHFANPVGYDDAANFSTTRDLATLAQYFLRDDFLRQTVATSKTGIDSVDGLHHELYSTNNLFGSYLQIRGLKTGLTDAAGECVATIAKIGNGREILAIVLHSPSRFQEAKSLISWAEENFRW